MFRCRTNGRRNYRAAPIPTIRRSALHAYFRPCDKVRSIFSPVKRAPARLGCRFPFRAKFVLRLRAESLRHRAGFRVTLPVRLPCGCS